MARWPVRVVAFLAFVLSGRATSGGPADVLNLAQLDTSIDRGALATEAKAMFMHGYSNYIERAFPMDELRPLSCDGKNTFGGVALTLVDSLDALVLFQERDEFTRAVRWLTANLTFDVPARVSVFESTIRLLGGLLSAHGLILRSHEDAVDGSPALVPEYTGGLLRLAVALGDKLLAAYNTPSGIPLPWLYLMGGPCPKIRTNCPAGGGTATLEMALLSHYTGNVSYFAAAKGAVWALANRRSALGLLGGEVHVDSPPGFLSTSWPVRTAGIGAGIDSFFEYLLKTYLMTGDADSLALFGEMYSAVHSRLRGHDGATPGGGSFFLEVEMDTGLLASPYLSSLAAFWPGVEALLGGEGHLASGAALHARTQTAAVSLGGLLPESLHVVRPVGSAPAAHPVSRSHPLRPEHIESAFHLHEATHETVYLEVGRAAQRALQSRARTACGYASLADVGAVTHEDTFESFFLAETTKYLLLLFDESAAAATRGHVLSTEGHLLPVLPGLDEPNTTAADPWARRRCVAICQPPPLSPPSPPPTSHPRLLRARPAEVALLRRRRCAACLATGGQPPPPAPMPLSAPAPAPTPANNPSAVRMDCRLDPGVINGPSTLTCGVGDAPPATATESPDVTDGMGATSLVLWLQPAPGIPPPAPAVMLGAHVWDKTNGAWVSSQWEASTAEFGAPLTPQSWAPPFAGIAVASDPDDGCTPLRRWLGASHGAAVVIRRGGCSFELKAWHAQSAGGAMAVIVSDSPVPIVMGRDNEQMGQAGTVTIPAVLLPSGAGTVLLGLMRAAAPANVWVDLPGGGTPMAPSDGSKAASGYERLTALLAAPTQIFLALANLPAMAPSTTAVDKERAANGLTARLMALQSVATALGGSHSARVLKSLARGNAFAVHSTTATAAALPASEGDMCEPIDDKPPLEDDTCAP